MRMNRSQNDRVEAQLTSIQPTRAYGRIAILGATGRLGRHTLAHLLNRRHKVHVLVHRTPFEVSDSNISMLHGDVRDPSVVRRLLTGCDAVVSTLGSANSDQADTCAMAAKNIVTGMREMETRRVVMTTGSAARQDGEIGVEHLDLQRRREILMWYMAGLILDGEEMMRTLSGSELDWTVVRLPRMVPGHKPDVTLSSTPSAPNATIGYESAAMAIVSELLESRWLKQCPFAISN